MIILNSFWQKLIRSQRDEFFKKNNFWGFILRDPRRVRVNYGQLNQVFHYTRCNTQERETSLRGPSPRHYACGQHNSIRRNVAAVTSRRQHCVRIDPPKI